MNKEFLSSERRRYLKEQKRRKRMILLTQVLIILLFLGLWELLAQLGVIDSFIMSSPSRIGKTLLNFQNNGLLLHISTTVAETVVGFALGTLIGTLLAVVFWWSEFLAKVSEPFLVVLNSLPKVALGPVIIIWVGAGTEAIIVMALAISTIVAVLEMLGGFLATDRELLRMARTFGASRMQSFLKIVLPYNIRTLFNSLKVNIGLSLVGVITGEFLVSKAGLGYLIVYGGQVFKLDLVMSSVIILAVLAALLYRGVLLLERLVVRRLSHTS